MTRETKEQKLDQDPVQNIPAFLPYEAKQALLREMNNRNERNINSEESKRKPKQNPLEEKPKKPEDDSADHFLYGNVPVVEYQLSNGSGGTVKKTPRK